MSTAFTALEQKILQAKGLSDDSLGTLAALGVGAKDDFRTIGDAATLQQLLPEIDAATADAVMAWAVGAPAPTTSVAGSGSGAITVESSDVVSCVHCSARQPKDYSSGDLCTTCGNGDIADKTTEYPDTFFYRLDSILHSI